MGEYLHSLTAARLRLKKRIVIPSGDGHVSAEKRHAVPFLGFIVDDDILYCVPAQLTVQT